MFLQLIHLDNRCCGCIDLLDLSKAFVMLVPLNGTD